MLYLDAPVQLENNRKVLSVLPKSVANEYVFLLKQLGEFAFNFYKAVIYSPLSTIISYKEQAKKSDCYVYKLFLIQGDRELLHFNALELERTSPFNSC